ncbi:flagellar hook protein FlgE [Amorphus orientalis]|uniref:Flagellar hook protein FlgE n=1 Tax=Amorphus orientalis TaxID=649198 RepID=A0AAE4AWA8_9HYPH|nr:flagellar hook protein FlgE [Amorphus orientalis]MDQ0317579.1 flagellar hook protein FlgE [Amorphus orientalis]
MSLYGMLRTGVSGMNAQSTKLSTVGDNIANADTTGYKRASTEFSSLLMQNSKTSYNSGSVVTNVRYAISQEGPRIYTTSPTDLAVNGSGFFVVQDPSGQPFLTRAGGFEVDGATGLLKNQAGFTLMGYDISGGQQPAAALNGYANMVPVDLTAMNMQATPTTTGELTANIDARVTAMAAPGTAAAPAAGTYHTKSSIVTYDNLGGEVVLDMYFTKTGADTWQFDIYDSTGGAALSTNNLTFDPTTGQLTAPAAGTVGFNIPGGQPMTLDISSMSQLKSDYTPLSVERNGNAASVVSDVEIGTDGTVQAVYENGSKIPVFRIPLVDVPSPDKLEQLAGNVFQTTLNSGDIMVGFPTEGSNGEIISGALEQSNVDLATEFTEMIVAQRSYTGNSKVFQTGNELLEVLMNLKR